MKRVIIMKSVFLLILIGLYVVLAEDTCSSDRSESDDVKKCPQIPQIEPEYKDSYSEDVDNVNIHLQPTERRKTNENKLKTGDLHKADNLIDAFVDEHDLKVFPPLTRLEPGKVGDVAYVELEDDKTYQRITRAVSPPVFEIPDYLSEVECEIIINLAQYNGLERSRIVGEDTSNEYRVSEQTWLLKNQMPAKLWENLVNRLSRLIHIPTEVIELSEPLQVVKYNHGGHCHAHLDSGKTSEYGHLPCCFQSPHCYDTDFHPDAFENCCRICRYSTVLYYLNDVKEGGETAFPLADSTDALLAEKTTNLENQSWFDLTNFCHNASLVLKPKRGTAIMWYNHLLDSNTSYLGETDLRSYHGGCDVIGGNKWIANNWISATTFKDRNKSWS